jgi:hypothetical protein
VHWQTAYERAAANAKKRHGKDSISAQKKNIDSGSIANKKKRAGKT